MAKKSKALLSSEILTNFPTNDNQEITAAIDRAQRQDIVDSFLGLSETTSQSVSGPVTFENELWAGGRDLSRRDGAYCYMLNNATNTTITAANTPAKVAGTFVAAHTDDCWTLDTTGKATFTCDTGHNNIFAHIDFAPVSGSGIKLAVYIALNGTVIADSISRVTASSGNIHAIASMTVTDVVLDDYIEVYVANIDNDTDILVQNCRVMIFGH